MSAHVDTAVDLDWEAAIALVTGGATGDAPTVVAACHVGPDGDALGSMLGLAIALRRVGVPVVCSWGNDPVAVPAAYDYLPGQELIVPHDRLPSAPDVVVTLDTGSADRLGLLAPLAERAGAVLVIDHHASNTRFGTHHLLDSSAAATAVLVSELVDRLGVPLDQDIAACLYTGLTTDTGSFKFVATTPAVHHLAARLLATGIRHDLISRAIWDTNPFGYIQLLARALARTTLEADALDGLGLVWTHTTLADLTDRGLALEQLEGVIDVIRTVGEAEVAVVCKADLDGTLKVSTRAKGAVDVGAACVALGGGGHRYAAGFTSTDDVPTTMAALRRELGRVGRPQ